MVSSDFHVKIGDFGHIKILDCTVKAPMSVAASSKDNPFPFPFPLSPSPYIFAINFSLFYK